jgi:transposase-like protein
LKGSVAASVWYGERMSSGRPVLFRKRQFEPAVIVACVRWHLRFSLSLRDVEELMAERNLAVDHTTVRRWVQAYAPEIRKRLQGQLKYKRTTWIMGETYVRVAGRWM